MQVPMFFSRQVFVKSALRPITEPSGMLTSLTKKAASQGTGRGVLVGRMKGVEVGRGWMGLAVGTGRPGVTVGVFVGMDTGVLVCAAAV